MPSTLSKLSEVGKLRNGDVIVYTLNARVFIGQKKEVQLNMREYKMLLTFIRRVDKIILHNYFYDVLKIEPENLRSAIHRLRTKLGQPNIIIAKKNTGYQMIKRI